MTRDQSASVVPLLKGSRTWSWVCRIPGRVTEHGLLVPQVVDNKINKFRHVILEILHRLPNNEILKPFVQELLLLVMNVVDVDNEENAIQGLRVIFDLQKNYRPQLEAEVPRFLQVSHGEGLRDRAASMCAGLAYGAIRTHAARCRAQEAVVLNAK